MKKIRLLDQTELEVYNISDAGNTLSIDMLNVDSSAMEAVFSNSDNLSIIQYFVGSDLIKGYAGYTGLQRYQKNMGQTISIDYATPDSATESGFAEETADIFTVILIKPEKIEAVEALAEQNRADLDYIAMETGVEV